MAVRIGENVLVDITVGGEVVTFVFPPYEEMAEAIRRLCASKLQGWGPRQRLEIYGPRERFLDETLLEIKGAEYKAQDGSWKPLTSKIADWKAKIPVNWKYSAASFFEESEALSQDELKN